MIHPTPQAALDLKKNKKLPWYRGLWWTIWLTILAAVVIYSAGTFLYFCYVITPSIEQERSVMQQERESYLQEYRQFIQEQSVQYQLELEEWRSNTPVGTPAPSFNYQERTRQFRESHDRRSSDKEHGKPKNPIDPMIWLSFMVLIIGAATYPVAKRLTKRLEKLQQAVETFGTGNLNIQVQVSGHDEVARLAQSFNDSAEQIKSLIQQHKDLLAHVSHELRTPLARLRMSAELASLQAPEVAQDLRTDIKELDELVGEILLASRLDAVPDLLKMTSFDAFALAAEEAARTRAELEGYSVEVQADETLVRRALRNLLTNAEKYAPESHALLTVFLEKAKDNTPEMVCFRVKDQGPGLPEDERENIFKPFFRGTKTKSSTHGFGLGLSLVAQIARRHHGSIRYQPSEEEHGGIFELRIPTKPTEITKNQ